jgi:hypothetical protein
MRHLAGGDAPRAIQDYSVIPGVAIHERRTKPENQRRQRGQHNYEQREGQEERPATA